MRLAGRVLVAAGVALLIGAVVAAAASSRGLTGTVDHVRTEFTKRKQDKQNAPARLLSTNGGNRWVWWKEAAGAFSDRPLRGWGAGSFPITHKLYRRDDLEVLQPHSVPLQFLAETGVVGGVLGLGGLACLFAAGVGAVRRRLPAAQRGAAAALLGASAAWLVHCCYDWDWDIPGVSIPLFLFLGVLAGRWVARPGGVPAADDAAGVRGASLAAVGLLMAVVVISAALPAWADSKATDALASLGGRPTPRQLADAQKEADVAARLNPLAVSGLFAEASIAERRGRLGDARHDLLAAVQRQPYNQVAWYKLARIEFALADVPGVQRAFTRALALDPYGVVALEVAANVQRLRTPAEGSATATGTPLPAAP